LQLRFLVSVCASLVAGSVKMQISMFKTSAVCLLTHVGDALYIVTLHSYVLLRFFSFFFSFFSFLECLSDYLILLDDVQTSWWPRRSFTVLRLPNGLRMMRAGFCPNISKKFSTLAYH
jgi:hypothetical protein